MKILCAFGQHNYGNPSRGLSYEYANFLPALRSLGHEVTHFESWNKDSYEDFCTLNRAFLDAVDSTQPDIIFCVLVNYEIWLETMEAVRARCHAVTIHWGTDDSWKYKPFARWVAPAFDLYVTTAREAFNRANSEGHLNFVLSQWAASGNGLREPIPAANCQYQVSFVGSAYGNRTRWISKLKDRGIKVNCFGYGWESGAVPAEEIPRIILNSVISLNFGDSGLILQGLGAKRSRQIKARVFEVPGAGGFLLTENAPDLEKFYDINKEIVSFAGVEDLAKKIELYLSNPACRDEIAQRGYKRTSREHTYELRFSRILSKAIELKTKRGGKVAILPFDSKWFENVAARHQAGLKLRFFRKVLVSVFGLFFGRERGARAARRFVYEISWRMCREKTYTAAGIPGRMFYRES